MARILTIRGGYLRNADHILSEEYAPWGAYRKYKPSESTTTINLDTVFKMKCHQCGYDGDIILTEKKLSFIGKVLDLFSVGSRYDCEETCDRKRPIFEIEIEYKRQRRYGGGDTFYVDKDEYGLLKKDLAKYGWHI